MRINKLRDSCSESILIYSGNEANLAIGTTSADEIKSNTSYYYIYNLKGSNGTSSMYKISAQEGYYLIFPSTLATFAQSTTHLIPFKSGYTAPESRGWYTEVEPNNSTSNADTRYTAKWLSGVLSTKSDIDYVKIYLSGQKKIRFISPANTDYDLTVYNASGSFVAGLYSTSSEQVKTYTFSAGYYYFKVYSYDGSSTTNVYRLIVE